MSSSKAASSRGGAPAPSLEAPPPNTELESVHRVELAGRTFLSGGITTMRQDLQAMRLIQKVGAQHLQPDESKDAGEMMMDVIFRAVENGVLFEMLAAVLVEEGKSWSESSAKANAEFFAGLTDPQDKERLNASLAGVILAFFMSALERSGISPNSLIPKVEAGVSLEHLLGIVEPSTMESSIPSSES